MANTFNKLKKILSSELPQGVQALQIGKKKPIILISRTLREKEK